MRWLNKPWIHFIFLGFLLFYLQGVVFPAPKPVIGPLNEAREEALIQQWFKATGRLPSEAQKARMIDAELDRDMLFQRALGLELYLYDTVVYQRLLRNMRFLQMAGDKSDQELYEQALEMRLHLGDEVIKRRMIQVMEQLLLAANPPAAPTEMEIAAEFEQRREELRRPSRYSIEHLYFNREREDEVEEVIATIQAQQLSPQQARELSTLSKQEKEEYIMDVNQEEVRRVAEQHHIRLLIHGHTHRPGIYDFRLGEREITRIVLGDWYRNGNVLKRNWKQIIDLINNFSHIVNVVVPPYSSNWRRPLNSP